MLPKKKRKLFVLYSIPIVRRLISIYNNGRYNRYNKLPNKNLCKEKMYLVSYSIPLACMVALLLVGMIAVNPNIDDKSHAMDVRYEVAAKNDVVTNNVGQVSADGTADDMAGDSVSGPQRAVARAVMPSTISLNITGDRNAEVETGTGVTAYRSHGVNVTVTDVQEYFLRISGTTELTPPTGGTAIPGVGTTGVKGSEMAENTWGYAWTSDGSSVDSEDDMMFVSMPSAATSLAIPNLVDGNASFSGKLSFGAKFAATSVLGNYTSGVQLTLIATPKSNTSTNHGYWYNENGAPTGLDSGTASMQDAAPNFCAGNSQVGTDWTVQLEDNRDGKTYTIVKLKDGNCWMQENLALEADPKKYPDGMTLAPGDTDLPADTTWILPKSVTSWSTNNTVAQVRTGSTSLNDWQQGYGNYYSWSAATAGTGTNVTSDGGAAPGSICPKGWTLPTGGAGGQLRNLFGTDGNDLGTTTQIRFNTIQQAPYSFSVTGFIRDNNGSLLFSSDNGYYWSRTSNSTTNAYSMIFNPNLFYPGTNSGVERYFGLSVRCVQNPYGYGVWEGNTSADGVLNTGIWQMQNITKANFTDRFCTTAQNSLVSVGSTVKMLDNRDSREYVIVKLPDGNCWMQQNLALGDMSSAITLTSADSDVTNDYILPANTTNWSTTTGQFIRVSNTNMANWKPEYGNYYSWNAATAGTGSRITSGLASDSICPKSWKLPDRSQFQTLFGTNGTKLGNTNTAKFANVQSAPYKFPAAGFVNIDGSYGSAETYGAYWPRDAYSGNSSAAYSVTFDINDFKVGTGFNHRGYGYSVRCVAEPTD